MAQAGVIRDFVVALGFTTDKSKAEDMKEALKSVEFRAGLLNKALLGLAVGATIAVTKTASELDKLYFSSQRIGASANNINAYGNAIAQLGGSAEGAVGSLESLAEKMRNSPGYESQINSLGVQTKDANGAMRDRVEVMKDLSGVLSNMPAYQANAYASSLGIDQNTLLAMRDGKFVSNMDKYQKIQKELGMNDDLTKSGNEFMSEYRDLTMMTKTGFQVLVMQAGKALIPILKLLNTMIQAGIHAFSQLHPAIKGVLATGLQLVMFALVLKGVATSFSLLKTGLSVLKMFIPALKAFRLAFLASPIGIILALASALYMLYDDYKTWKEGGKSLFDWSKWTNGIDTIIGKIKDFLAILDKIKDKVVNFVQKIVSDPIAAVQDVVESAKDVAKNAIDEVIKPNGEPANDTVKAVNQVSKTIVDSVKETTKKAVEVAVGVAKVVQGEVKGITSNASKPYKTAMTEFKGGLIKGLTPEQTLAFANRVMFRENKSGNTDVLNKWGYTGKYQFGASALAETGYIDRTKLDKAAKGVKSGSNAKAHRAFLADKSNWLIGNWDQYRHSHEMQDTSFRKLTEINLKYGKSAHGNNVKKMMGFAMAAHLKGAGNARKWYTKGIDSKDGNGTRISDYAQFGEGALKWAIPINNSTIRNTGISNIKNVTPPTGNPYKSQVGNSSMTASNVTIHQSFKTDMTINGAREPIDSANAVKRQQENQLAFMARGAQSVLT